MTTEQRETTSEPQSADAGAPAEPAVYTGEERPRGLDAMFAPGGEDTASPERVADERKMLRLLLLMIVILVGFPTLLTIIAVIGQLTVK